MKQRLQNFMMGRYGQDQLNRVLMGVALALCILSLLTGWQVVYTFGLVLVIVCMVRVFSRNIEKRRKENHAYGQLVARIVRFFAGKKARVDQRKTHRYYTCPACHQQLRVPKGRGKISINCPKCSTLFEKKT